MNTACPREALDVSGGLSPAARWRGQCTVCDAGLGVLPCPAAPLACPACGTVFPVRNGVLSLMSAGRLKRYERFLDEYTRIRHAEGRGALGTGYFRRLPEPTPSDPLAAQWAIRNISYHRLHAELLAKLAPLRRVLDLGAGVGWLSERLAALNHVPLAVDLSVEAQDGLGAAVHYGHGWPRIQAEFDRLPLEAGQAHLAIFNSSFHYSTDYEATLREALRVLEPDGRIVVMDTPVYKAAASGERMKTERHSDFARRYGYRSDSLASIDYLTWDMLRELGRKLTIEWQVIRPWYGWRWHLRPHVARLRGRREPSTFIILIGTRAGIAR